MLNVGNVVVIDFPGVTGIKRRPAVVLSSAVYHASRPDVVVGLITSQTTLPPSAHPVVVGHLSDRDWQGVRVGVKTALAALDDPAPPAAPEE